MQTATSETESKSLELSMCVHHYTLRAPCPKGQGKHAKAAVLLTTALGPLRRDLRFCQCWKGRNDAESECSLMPEKDCPATGVTGPGRRLPPCPPHRPELRAATARRDFRGSTRPR